MSINITIKEELEKRQEDFKKLLPSHVNLARFIKSAALAVYSSKKLQECSRESIFKAIYNAAEVGLDFTPIKAHAYLVPFKGQAMFIPGYRGLIDIAKRNGIVKKIEAHVVYENDLFKIQYGSDPKIEHIPCMSDDTGKIIGAYAIAFYSDGTIQPEFMNTKELEKVRKCNKIEETDYSPYINWLDEMYRKAPIRRLFKFLPSNPDIDRITEIDNEIYELPEMMDIPPIKNVDDLKDKLRKDMGDTQATSTGSENPTTKKPNSDPVSSSHEIAIGEICDKKHIPYEKLKFSDLVLKYNWHASDTPIGLEERLQFVKTRIGIDIQGEIVNLLTIHKVDSEKWLELLAENNCDYIWELDKPKANAILKHLKALK